MRATYCIVGTVILAGGVIQLEACGGGDPSVDGGTVDSPTVDIGPPFTIAVSPSHITEDIGDTVPVTVSQTPDIGYVANFTVSTADGLTIKQPGLLYAPFTIEVTAVSVPASGPDTTITITATSGSIVQTATLGVRIGSRLLPDDAGVVVIPPYANQITTKLWGAGGGGGPDCVYNSITYAGSAGGGGGYAIVDQLMVVPGETFRVVEGTGGSGVVTVGAGGGGGGGGYSAFMDADGGIIAIAAGGGGGTAAWCQYPPDFGNSGGAAGGPSGGDGTDYSLGGHGAQADAGGSSVGNGGAGSLFTGGAGGGTGAVIAGGTPGGGSGNAGARGGGGGGGGHFGGGGGSSADGGGAGPSNGGGGGGGGSWVPKDSLGTFPANGSQPARATDSDIGDAGAGYGRQGNGGPGRVVVLLPKP